MRVLALAVALSAASAITPCGVAAAGSASRGSDLFQRQCAVCHAVTAEFHKEGPSLHGVHGRRAGTAPFFAGYKGLKGATFIWDERTLDAWLADPRQLLDGRNTGMTLRVDDPAARADLIAYMKTLK